jgi:hypothetical protein
MFVLLLAVYFLALFTRTTIAGYQKSFYGSIPFTLESALLFRYADMIARGEQIPANDRAAQYPEGLEVTKRLSIAQEYVTGSLYRWFFAGRMPLADCIRSCNAAIFSLGVFAVFLIVFELTRLVPAGIVAALFYAVGLPSVIRSTGQEIMGENWALPLIIFHLWGFLMAMSADVPGRRRIISALFSALCIALAAVMWDMTQVYLFLMTGFAALCFLFSQEYKSVALPFLLCVCAVLAASLVNPYLRWHQVFFSYPMAVSYALAAATFAARGFSSGIKFKWKLFFVVLSSGLVVAASVFSKYQDTYSHFAQLLYYKILFLNTKPADPSLLPYVVRSLWVPALQSVSLWDAVRFFTTMIPLSIGGGLFLLSDWFRRRLSAPWKYIVFLTVMFIPLYVLFYRMEVFLIFLVCVVIGGSVYFFGKYFPKISYIWIVAIALSLVFETQKTFAGVPQWGRNVDYPRLDDIVAWTASHTPPESVILGTFALSPSILTYAGRSIVVHPKYEDQALRAKVRIFDLSLFAESEEDFYLFCWKTGATHYIHSRGTYADRSINGRRYLAGAVRPSVNTNAYKFEVAPEKLTQFRKLYDNGRYIVFKVITDRDKKNAEDFFGKGTTALKEGKYADAAGLFQQAIDAWPGLYKAYTGLVNARSSMGDTAGSAQAAQDLFRKLGVKKVEGVSSDE